MAEQIATSATAAAVAKVKQMQQDAARTREDTRTQIVAVIEGHIAELAELDFHYRLVEDGDDMKPAKRCGHCGSSEHSTRSCPSKEQVA